MELGVEEFQGAFDSVNDSLAELRKAMDELKGELCEERSKRKKAEARARKLDQQLKFAWKNQFGDKRQRAKKKGSKEEDADRNHEKDGFDGTEETLSTRSVPESPAEGKPAVPQKERDLTNRPESYDTMSVEGTPVFHPTDESKVPGRIIERKTVRLFSLKMCLMEERFEMVHYVEPGKKPKWGYFPTEGHPEVVPKFEGTEATPEFMQALAYEVYVKNVTFGLLHRWLTDMGMTISANTLHNWLKKGKKYLDKLVVVPKSIALEKDSIGDELKSAQFKDTEHQICLAHAMAKFVKAANPGGDKEALPFHDDMREFYKRERQYDKEGLSPEERGRRRQDLETKEIQIRLRGRLEAAQAKNESKRSPYLTEVLNYLDKSGTGSSPS